MVMVSNNTEFMKTDEHNRTYYCDSSLHKNSRGIWFGDNPLENPLTLTLLQITLVVMTSRVLYYFLKPLGQTKFVCYLLGGILLGPSLLGHSKEIRDNIYGKKVQYQMFDTIAEIGSIYAIFLMSLKFDFAVLKRNARKSWKIGIGGFIFPTVVTFSLIYPITGIIPKFPWLPMTVTLSFTYFPVIAQALYELNLMSSELGQLAMSSAMLNDVLEWIFLAAGVVATQSDCFNGIRAFLSILGLFLFTLYVIRPLMLWIIKNTPEGKEVNEIYIVGILLGVLVMSVISDTMGLLSVGGPIFMGLVIPDGPPLGAAIKQKTEFVVSEFLLPMYFFRIGVSTDVHAIGDKMIVLHLQSIILVLFVSKIVGVTLSGLLRKISFRNSFVLSLIMSMKGLIEINALRHWNHSKIIDEQFYNQTVLSSLVLTMIVMPIVRFLYIPQMRLGKSTKDLRVRNIQSTLKDEAFSVLFCVHNEENAGNIITLLEASNPTDESPICAYVVHRVDLVGHSVPQLTPYKKRNKFRQIDRAPTNQMMQAFENYSNSSRGPVVIEAYNMVAPYTTMHENIFRLALENLVPLIIVPFHENHQSVVGPSMTGPIRQFNLNVQESSPCTIGILVDRGLCCRPTKSSFSINVAVFFIGGPDDREALAYASRMADNPDVCLTVFRIIMWITNTKSDEDDLFAEVKVDESLINEFKLRNAGNDRLNWHDTEVENCVEVMDVIRNSQGKYDLVMVGRRHPEMSLRDEEMTDFIQNPELGMIGDMLASRDFCNGMVNVLVMQESRKLSYGAYHNESIACTGIVCTS